MVMKTKIIYTSLAFLLLSSLIFVACCKKKCTDASNPECENYDKCLGKVPNAGFKIRRTGWNDFEGKWFNYVDEIPFSDTILLTSLDLLADFDSLPGCKYIWKFDGMSSTFKTKDLVNINFTSYASNPNNDLPLWDSFFSKPLGVTLTVIAPLSDCNTKDTLFTQKRFITFVKRPYHYGSFKGYFSTNPTKEVDITMNQYEPQIWDLYFLHINFPYHENDTISVADKQAAGWRSIYDDFYSSCTKFKWEYDLTKPYDLNINKGILGLEFNSKYNSLLKRIDVNFSYKYQKSKSEPIETISFTGYQTFAFAKSFPY
jgi:hypothetical protein